MAACQPTNRPLKSLNFPVGASLLAKAPCQPTVLQMNTQSIVGAGLPAMAACEPTIF